MKKIIVFVLALMILLMGNACSKQEEPQLSISEAQIKDICELAVLECYYHNVAKFDDKDPEKFLFWTKNKRFWIEYDGIVKMGIDASLVDVEPAGTEITITIPPAFARDPQVDSSSLTKDSYIVDKNSTEITAEDEQEAFKQAQAELKEMAETDQVMLNIAQQRAKKLLEDYVANIGKLTDTQYTIKWVEVDAQGNPI